jgi:hypothetical protein
MNRIIKGKHKKTLIFPVLSGELVFYLDYSIAIPENNASNPAYQSVKSCVRYLCRASARLLIPSLSFALC